MSEIKASNTHELYDKTETYFWCRWDGTNVTAISLFMIDRIECAICYRINLMLPPLASYHQQCSVYQWQVCRNHLSHISIDWIFFFFFLFGETSIFPRIKDEYQKHILISFNVIRAKLNLIHLMVAIQPSILNVGGWLEIEISVF